MGKHHDADEKLVSGPVRKKYLKNYIRPKDYTAPQVPKPGSNSKNQYR